MTKQNLRSLFGVWNSTQKYLKLFTTCHDTSGCTNSLLAFGSALDTLSFGMKTMKTKGAVRSRGTNKSARRCLLSRLMLLSASSQTRLGGTLMKVKQLLRLLLGDKHPKVRFFFSTPLAYVNVLLYFFWVSVLFGCGTLQQQLRKSPNQRRPSAGPDLWPPPPELLPETAAPLWCAASGAANSISRTFIILSTCLARQFPPCGIQQNEECAGDKTSRYFIVKPVQLAQLQPCIWFVHTSIWKLWR